MNDRADAAYNLKRAAECRTNAFHFRHWPAMKRWYINTAKLHLRWARQSTR